MIEQPLLVATTRGPIGAIVGLPDDEPRAAVVFLPGREESRAGANQTWVRTTRSLNRNDVATVRADYAGTAESWDADRTDRVGGSGDLVCAFREIVGDVPLIGLAACYGLTPLSSLAREHALFSAAAVVTPPVYGRARNWSKASVARPTIRARARQAPRRVAFRMRYGKAQPRWAPQASRESRDGEAQLTDLVAACPTWILTGAEDGCTAPLHALLPMLQAVGHVELEVVSETALYRTSTPDSQASVREHVGAWVQRCLQALGTAS